MQKYAAYAVYKIRETLSGSGTKLSAEDGFLQFMIERLLASNAPSEEVIDDDREEEGDSMKLTSIQSITVFYVIAPEEHYLIISDYGQEEILQLHAQARYLRKKDIMHKEHFQ